MNFVVYLTGPPATGKSTISRALAAKVPNLKFLSYSALLSAALIKEEKLVTEDNLRAQSAKVITPELVDSIDLELIAEVGKLRRMAPVIIDSHPVTIESYGYRITPFKMSVLRVLRPTHIVMLFCEAKTIQERITANSQGRPMPSTFQADFHTQLQAQVAVSYALELGLPMYLLDSSHDSEAVVLKLQAMIENA